MASHNFDVRLVVRRGPGDVSRYAADFAALRGIPGDCRRVARGERGKPWFPDMPGIQRWKDAYRRTAYLGGYHPDAGRMLKSWALQAGFDAGDGEVPPVPVAPTIAVTLAPSLILLAGQPIGAWQWASAAAGVAALAWGLPKIIAPKARGFGPGIPSIVLARAIQAGSFFAAETILLVTLQAQK